MRKRIVIPGLDEYNADDLARQIGEEFGLIVEVEEESLTEDPKRLRAELANAVESHRFWANDSLALDRQVIALQTRIAELEAR